MRKPPSAAVSCERYESREAWIRAAWMSSCVQLSDRARWYVFLTASDQKCSVGLLGGSGAARVVRGRAIEGNDAAAVRNASLHTGAPLFQGVQWRG
eukprot:28969_2